MNINNINFKKSLVGFLSKKYFSVSYPKFEYPFYPITHSAFKSTKAGKFSLNQDKATEVNVGSGRVKGNKVVSEKPSQ
jgi:hypothetical protein